MLVTPVNFPALSEARCVELWFGDESFSLRLEDGRVLEIPLQWYPRLADAQAADRDEWRFIGGGIGIHWPKIDEDIPIAELLGGSY